MSNEADDISLDERLRQARKIVNPTPHIRYHNPYGGHPILRRKGTDAYAAMTEFLRRCTDWNVVWEDVKISATPADKFVIVSEETKAAIAEIAQVLGTPSAGIHTGLWEPASGDIVHVAHDSSWKVPTAMHDWAIARVLATPPAKRGWSDSLQCEMQASFRLRAPDGDVLPGQAEVGHQYAMQYLRSGIFVHVSAGNTSAFFDLTFPFPEANQTFVQYVAAIRPFLPIRLAKGNFKRYVPNKARDEYVIRRVSRDVLQAV